MHTIFASTRGIGVSINSLVQPYHFSDIDFLVFATDECIQLRGDNVTLIKVPHCNPLCGRIRSK